MIVAIVRFTLPVPLSVDDARSAFEPGAPAYQTIPGLHRKHYLVSEDGATAGGIYLWESKAHAEATYTEEWATRLTKRYGAAPTVEYFMSPLTVEPNAISADPFAIANSGGAA